jgi:hypothetical protein
MTNCGVTAKPISTAVVAAMLLLFRCNIAGSAPLRISYATIASNTAGIWMAEGSGAFKR